MENVAEERAGAAKRRTVKAIRRSGGVGGGKRRSGARKRRRKRNGARKRRNGIEKRRNTARPILTSNSAAQHACMKGVFFNFGVFQGLERLPREPMQNKAPISVF